MPLPCAFSASVESDFLLTLWPSAAPKRGRASRKAGVRISEHLMYFPAPLAGRYFCCFSFGAFPRSVVTPIIVGLPAPSGRLAVSNNLATDDNRTVRSFDIHNTLSVARLRRNSPGHLVKVDGITTLGSSLLLYL